MRTLTITLAAILAVAVPAFGQTTTPTPPVQGPATITDNYGNRRGYVSQSGVVTDNYGNRRGYISPPGVVTDNYGNRLGQVKK
jgi:hypothetical protein